MYKSSTGPPQSQFVRKLPWRQAPASQSAFLAGDAPEKMELDAPVAKEACSKVADSSEANAPNGNAPSQDPALREPRMLSSPYAGRCRWMISFFAVSAP